jgi:hypothetical protein
VIAGRPSVLAVLVAAVLGAAVAAPTVGASHAQQSSPVRMNELQVIGTHNSYKRELTETEQATYDGPSSSPSASSAGRA